MYFLKPKSLSERCIYHDEKPEWKKENGKLKEVLEKKSHEGWKPARMSRLGTNKNAIKKTKQASKRKPSGSHGIQRVSKGGY